MAKEFKDFDSKYAYLKGELLEGENQIALQSRAGSITSWEYHKEIVLWSNAEIREAVYMASSAEAWQQFRVSLKGFTTEMKLARLEARYLKIRHQVVASLEELGESNKNMLVYDTSLSEEEKMEKCRIDNYMGALRRGGQLDASYRIVG